MPYNDQLLTEAMPLAYRDVGAGKTIVLLHGFPFDNSIWAAQIEALQANYRVIAPDLRGHGGSPAPEGAYSVDLMARDVLLTLDQIGVEKAVWVGHSMGGYVTLAAWWLAPERFTGFGMVASNHRGDNEEARAKRYETAEKVSQQGTEAAVNKKVFKAGTPEDLPVVQRMEAIMRSTSPAGIIGTILAMAARPDSTEVLKQINVPALVIGGGADQLFKREIPEEMAKLLPNAQLIMAENSGHLPMLEEPELVTRALTALLDHTK